MNTIKVDSLPNFEFWLGMYKPRTKDWQRKHLAALRKGTNTFMNPNETNVLAVGAVRIINDKLN